MPVFLVGVLIVGGSVLLSVLGMLLVRRAVPLNELRRNNEVAGFIIAVVGVAYAVLLAFVVLTVWTQFETAGTTVAREASALASVYRISQGFSGHSREQLLALARDYGRVVTDEEWALMGQGAGSSDSPTAWKLVDDLWQAVRTAEPKTPREQALYAELINRVDELGSERKLRLLSAREGVPTLMWIVLLAGAALTMLFTYFFGVESVRVQALMTAGMAGSIALNLFMISAIEYPFSGDLKVTPEAFQQVLQVFARLEDKPIASR